MFKNLTYLLRTQEAELIEINDIKNTYWLSLFFLNGSMRRSVSLMTATFTSSSTRLGTFSNTPGESLKGKDSMLQWREWFSTNWPPAQAPVVVLLEFSKGSLQSTWKMSVSFHKSTKYMKGKNSAMCFSLSKWYVLVVEKLERRLRGRKLKESI